MIASYDAAFSAFFAENSESIRRIAYLICGDWHKADDLTQTAFVKLYGAWERVRDPAAITAYLRSCLMRAAVDESRRPWRRERVVEILPEHAEPDSDLGALVADRELFRRALSEVPAGQRAALVLRYYEGLDVAATAAALGCSEGNVKSQTARGLAALRTAVERLGISGPRPDRFDGRGR